MSVTQRKRSQDISDQNSGEKNGMFGVHGRDRPCWKGWYITPLACFDSEPSVCEYYGISRPAVQRRCKIGGTIGTNRWTPPEWWGKTWQDLGWYFIDKENYEGSGAVFKGRFEEHSDGLTILDMTNFIFHKECDYV